ncbi:MAG: YbaB/EbfC family nucleoid-associated protein [Jatrophihabitans sp.]
MTQTDDALGAYQQRVSEIAERAAIAREQMTAVRPSITSADGAVTVTVSAAGALEGITFGDAASAMELSQLSSVIMQTAMRARVAAAEQTRSALAGLVGESSPVLELMTRDIPTIEDEDDESSPAVADLDDAAAARPTAVHRPAHAVSEPDDEDGFTGRSAR